MPAQIHPDLLRNQLPPLGEDSALSADARAYQAYYGLDMPDVESRLGVIRVHGYEVVAQVWRPARPRATLVVLHGYYDHMGLYGHAIRWGLEMGFAVLACDLPGHGLSSGPRASINEFDEYQAMLRELLCAADELTFPQPWHLFGQSTGAAIALDYLLTQAIDPRVGRSILLAPLVRPRAWSRSRLSYEMLRRFVKQIPRSYSDNSGDATFLEFIRSSDPLQANILPTLWVGALSRWIPRIEGAARSDQSPIIVQGEADMTVDWRHNLKVLERKFTDPEILRLPTARHHLVNEQEDIRRQVFAFLGERLGQTAEKVDKSAGSLTLDEKQNPFVL